MASNGRDVLAIDADTVKRALDAREHAVMACVKEAYIAHSKNQSSLPHSTFLRFPNKPRDRIIALPAYLRTQKELAGIKWVASFPENIAHGIDRASASVILNDATTGRPYCFMDASYINAHRTAASACLAAKILAEPSQTALTIIGCGPINRAIYTYIHATFQLSTVHLYDTDPKRVSAFADELKQQYPALQVVTHTGLQKALRSSTLVSFATNAGQPHINDPAAFLPGSTILHVSLRDLAPALILNSYNLVDDPNHVNREKTSIHLAYEQSGNTDFIHAAIGDMLAGENPAKPNNTTGLKIFSPFGLGILDIAVANLIYDTVQSEKLGGTLLPNFLPPSRGSA